MMMRGKKISTQVKQQGWEGKDNSFMGIGRIPIPIRRKINNDNNLIKTGKRHRRTTTTITTSTRMLDKPMTKTPNGPKSGTDSSQINKKRTTGDRLHSSGISLQCLSFSM